MTALVTNKGWLHDGPYPDPANPNYGPFEWGDPWLTNGSVEPVSGGGLRLSDEGRISTDKFWWFFNEHKDISIQVRFKNHSTGYSPIAFIGEDRNIAPLGQPLVYVYIPLLGFAMNTDGASTKKWRLICGEDQYDEVDFSGAYDAEYTVRVVWYAETSTAKMFVNGTQVVETSDARPGAIDWYYKNFWLQGFPTTFYDVKVWNRMAYVEQN